MQIRIMEEKDLDEVTALEASGFSQPWKRHDFEEILQNPIRTYFVALEQEHIIGGCLLTEIAGEGEITNVCVKQEFRGQGIANRLMETLLEYGEKKNLTAFTLEVRSGNTAAIRLYQHFGFVTEGIRKNFYDKPVEDACIMWKRKINGNDSN